jgi:protoporphyrinogen oxidase
LTRKKAVIIGGGPAGLTAAYELCRHTEIQPFVIEMTTYWGGISRTENQNGNRIDIGGHRFFSKSDTVMDWWQDIMPIDSESQSIEITYQNKKRILDIKHQNQKEQDPESVMLVRKRKSRILSNNTFFDYPVTLSLETLKKLGLQQIILIGFSYVRSLLFPIRKEESLEDFFINRFGRRLYEIFFKSYTEKVWGVPCTSISADWGRQRIKGLSVFKTIKTAIGKKIGLKNKSISQKKTETSLIEYFLYPKYGPGQMWELVANKIGTLNGILMQENKVVGIHVEQHNIVSVEIEDVITGNTKILACDYLFSTMPVKHLIRAMDCKVPSKVKRVSNGLLYRDFITVGLLFEKINYELTDNWIYIQESTVNVGRIQIFNNWSPFLVSDQSKIWIGLEYFCSTEDAIWSMSDAEIVSMALEELKAINFVDSQVKNLDHRVIKVPKAYPAYYGTYSEFDVIRNFTDSFENLFLIGRNGMHHYNNQDHSMLTAIQAVKNIISNNPSKENIWEVNTEEDYHESK